MFAFDERERGQRVHICANRSAINLNARCDLRECVRCVVCGALFCIGKLAQNAFMWRRFMGE